MNAVFIHGDGTIRTGESNSAKWYLYHPRLAGLAGWLPSDLTEMYFECAGLASSKGNDQFGPAEIGPLVYIQVPKVVYEARDASARQRPVTKKPRKR